jgi:NAD(P)-dependent dehydrogenase (short-subunit alcohol dehydrogenase family)
MNQANKVAIVTGASSGIGKAAAVKFLEMGYTVHAAARRLHAMKDIEAKGAILHQVDLRQSEEINAFVSNVIASSGRVDVLVNSAGYGFFGAVEDVPMAAAKEQLEVNLFAVAQMIQAVLPVMRKQRSGKILNISSTGGKSALPLGGWYHASKFALEGLSDSLRSEVRPFGIDVVVVEPGAVKTEWGGIMVDNLMQTSGAGPYKLMVERLRDTVAGKQVENMSASPQEIGALIARIAETRKPKARYVAPFHAKLILFMNWLLCDKAADWVTGKMLNLPATL